MRKRERRRRSEGVRFDCCGRARERDRERESWEMRLNLRGALVLKKASARGVPGSGIAPFTPILRNANPQPVSGEDSPPDGACFRSPIRGQYSTERLPNKDLLSPLALTAPSPRPHLPRWNRPLPRSISRPTVGPDSPSTQALVRYSRYPPIGTSTRNNHLVRGPASNPLVPSSDLCRFLPGLATAAPDSDLLPHVFPHSEHSRLMDLSRYTIHSHHILSPSKKISPVRNPPSSPSSIAFGPRRGPSDWKRERADYSPSRCWKKKRVIQANLDLPRLSVIRSDEHAHPPVAIRSSIVSCFLLIQTPPSHLST